MRDALGALGPVDGMNPELSNLTCSLTLVDPGDIVFLTSDGVSDNFDPVVGKFCVPAKHPAVPAAPNQNSERQSKRNVLSKSEPSMISHGLTDGRPHSTPKRSLPQEGSTASPQGQGSRRSSHQPKSSLKPNQQQQQQQQAAKPRLPTVEAYQRHELTLLRMEDILNHGSHLNGTTTGRVTTAAELCTNYGACCKTA